MSAWYSRVCILTSPRFGYIKHIYPNESSRPGIYHYQDSTEILPKPAAANRLGQLKIFNMMFISQPE